ncbi:MAG: GntP family permease [Tissierellales bacterium]
MLGILGLLVAIILLVWLAYKGVGAIPASLICSLVVILTNGMNIWEGFSTFYIGGFSYFAGTYFLVFISSSLFAKAMNDSGSAQTIAYKFLDWFGAKRAILVLVLTTAVLTYGGVSLFVVVFAIYPIALVLLKEADIPKRLLPGILAFGAATFTMSALPASPQLTNVIPSQILGTTLTAAPLLGIFASILMFVAGYWYLIREEKKMKNLGIGFVAGPNDDMSKFENVDKSKLPGTFVSFLPMVLILLAIIFIKKPFAPLELVVYAMLFATVVIFVLNWSRMKNKINTINLGLKDGLAIISVAVIIGFGFVVQNAPAFQSFVNFALGLKMHPYLSAVIATEIVAGITGSSSGGLTIFLNALGQQYVSLGADPAVLHRLTAMAAGGLDTLPHAGGIFILLGVAGQSHKESYGPIFWTTVIIPIAVALICTFIAIAIF